MALALAPNPADSLRNLRDVRAWWRAHHPAASLGHRLELLYTIALVSAIFGALAYGTASSALAQVVTPHCLAVFGPSLALLAVLLAMHWGAYQGPVVFSVARCRVPARRAAAAPGTGRQTARTLARGRRRRGSGPRRGCSRRARRQRPRHRHRAGGGPDRGAGRAGDDLRGRRVGGGALKALRTGVEASDLAGRARGLGAGRRVGRGQRRARGRVLGRPVGLGGAVQRGRRSPAEWLAALLALTALTAVAAGAAIRTCGDASGERHLRRAEARAGAIASLASFDARTARQTLATVSTRETGRSRSGLSWLRASLATRGSQPAARTLAIVWRDTVAALRTPGRVVEAAALAAGGTVLSLLNTDKLVAVAAGMVLVYLGASRMLWPLRAELDLPSRTTVMLRPRLGRVLLAHALLPALVTTSAATLAAVGCAIAGALPTHGAIAALAAIAVTPMLTVLRRDVGPAPRSAAPKPSLRRRRQRSVRRRGRHHGLAGLLAHARGDARQHPRPTHHTLRARSHPGRQPA